METYRDKFIESVRILVWFYQDAVWRLRWRVFWIIAFEVISIALAALLIWVLVAIARTIGTGSSHILIANRLQFDSKSPVDTSIITGGIVFLGILSAVAFWISKRIVRSTTAEYQQFCTERVLCCLSGGRSGRCIPSKLFQVSRSKLSSLAVHGPLYLDHCFNWILDSFRYFIMAVFTGIAMIVLELFLVVILAPIFIFYAAAVVYLSHRARKSDTCYLQTRKQFRKILTQAPSTVDSMGHNELQDVESKNLLDTCRQMTQERANRRLVVFQTQYINSLLFAVACGVIVMYYTVLLDSGEIDWVSPLLVLVCMRFFISGVRSTTSTLIRLHLYANRIEPYINLISDSQSALEVTSLSEDHLTTKDNKSIVRESTLQPAQK